VARHLLKTAASRAWAPSKVPRIWWARSVCAYCSVRCFPI